MVTDAITYSSQDSNLLASIASWACSLEAYPQFKEPLLALLKGPDKSVTAKIIGSETIMQMAAEPEIFELLRQAANDEEAKLATAALMALQTAGYKPEDVFTPSAPIVEK